MELVSLNVGKPQTVNHNGQDWQTGIFKVAVTSPLFLSKLGFEGDQVADTVNHGGPDKAVNVYSHEHYAFWEQETGTALPPVSAFGENLTVRGMLERDVCIGDIYQIGDAVVQISQGRIPCGKITVRTGIEGMRNKFIETKLTGFYLRVLQEGYVSPGSTITLVEKHPAGITLEAINQLLYHEPDNLEETKRVLDSLGDTLSEVWRNILGKRLEPQTNE